MKLYQICYDCCTANPESFANELLKGIMDFVSGHLTQLLKAMLESRDFLSRYVLEWNQYRQSARLLNQACAYLNRHMLKKPGVPTDPTLNVDLEAVCGAAVDRQKCFLLWQSHVLLTLKRDHHNHLIALLLREVQNNRDGKTTDDDVIKGCVYSLVQVNSFSHESRKVYEEEYEEAYLEQTTSYYSSESNRAIQTLEIGEFIEKARERLLEELERSDKYLEGSSHLRAIYRFDSEYIEAHLAAIQAGMTEMILEERADNCRRAYDLVCRIRGGLSEPLRVFEDHVVKCVSEIAQLAGPEVKRDATQYIEKLFVLRKRFVQFAVKSFNKEAFFEGAVDKVRAKGFT
ncbi:Cullin-2 [Kappamyces sp. JEL0680]|nr:Cullin-2 [Kappamyces sp. JEL0680]